MKVMADPRLHDSFVDMGNMSEFLELAEAEPKQNPTT